MFAVFLLGRALYTTATGLLAAALLAVMPLHVAYSRQALSEANTAFFFTAAMLAYWVGRGKGWPPRWGLAVSAILLGVTVTTNYRLYVMMAVLLGGELGLWLLERGQSRLAFLRRCILLAYGSLLPVVAWMAFYRWMIAYYEATGLPLWEPIIPYEGQLKGFLLMMGSFSRPLFGDLDPLFYPYVLWNYVGPAVVVASMGALVLFPRDRGSMPTNLLLALWLLVPLVFYTVLTDKAPRCLAVALPAVALLAGRSIVLLLGSGLRGRPRPLRLIGRSTGAVLVALALTWGMANSWEVASLKGGYWAATNYLVEQGIPRVIAGQAPVVHFFGGRSLRVLSVPFTMDEVNEWRHRGFRHLLVDDQLYLDPQTRHLASHIETSLRPIASFPDTAKQGPLFFLEHSEWMRVNLDTTLALHQQVRALRGPSAVKLYDLLPLFDEGSGPESR